MKKIQKKRPKEKNHQIPTISTRKLPKPKRKERQLLVIKTKGNNKTKQN